MGRFARNRRVFYVEEPRVESDSTRLEIQQDESGVWIVLPYLSDRLSKEEGRAEHIRLINQLFAEKEIEAFIAWYYTPMAFAYTQQLEPRLTVYDCMDQLSAFNGAPKAINQLEKELIENADLVFTGGRSLYEVKKGLHPNVHLFPSSIDLDHFSQARSVSVDTWDQAGIPHPRLGYFGVIDERMDLELVAGIADYRPDWQLVLIGPFAKLDPRKLPLRQNIHYLGIKPYQALPDYLAGWDVAILPFAQNQATRYISPTKTPEYLAGGKPVVSTPIRDIVRPYGKLGLVNVAKDARSFVQSVEKALFPDETGEWLRRVDEFLKQNSWDQTWLNMNRLIEICGCKNHSKHAMEVPGRASAYDMPENRAQENEAQKRRNGKNHRRKTFDYLIVGAGFAGSVLAERLARGSGAKVLIIDRRPHVAGNAYDHHNQDGVLVHKYGPHIFHTNSKEVFSYLSQFTRWRPYEHRVLASVDGQLLPIPINLDTVNRLYGTNLNSFELSNFFESAAEPVEQIRTSEDVVISKIGRDLYEKFFRNYTRKQWDLDPSELDASVTSRVPIRLNRDDRYFTDVYQSMPLYGYTQMFWNILDHPNIKVMLNTDYRDIIGFIPYREMIYTGPIDEYFDYRFGKLPYRSLQFSFETLDESIHQPVAVINYPNEHPYTRSTEFKHLTGQDHPKTTLVYEYPCSEGDPYYPIPRQENGEIYKKYKQLAESASHVYFAGRLATYKYYNMDQVAAQALTLYSKLTGQKRNEATAAYVNSRYSIEMPCPMLVTQVVD